MYYKGEGEGKTSETGYLVIGRNSRVEKARRMARGEVVAVWRLQQGHQLVPAARWLGCDPYCRQGRPKQTESSNVRSDQIYTDP